VVWPSGHNVCDYSQPHLLNRSRCESYEEGFESEISIESFGLLKHIRCKNFVYIVYTVQKVLSELKPENKLLHNRDCDISSGIQFVQTALDNPNHIRDEADETLKTLWSSLEKHQMENCDVLQKRRRKLPANQNNAIVCTSGSYIRRRRTL